MQVLDLDALTLSSGSHESPSEGHCLLEVVSMFAGEPFSDRPRCVCPVLAAFGRSWNDGLPDADRGQLKQYIPRLLNTWSSKAVEDRRALMAADWLIREFIPAWLELTPALKLHAEALRAHPEIADAAGFLSIAPILLAAQKDTAAAWDAARAAAWDAARDAAWDAALDAAWDAARAAARDAAWAAAWAAARDAAGDAAWAAAWDAAWAALKSTTERLQISAHALYDRMINLTEAA